MTDRPTASTINDAQLDALYAECDRLAAELADYDERAEHLATELRHYTEADSADAAAGSYALRAERAEAQLARVIDLYERWVKAGPPSLGVSLSRWLDAQLVELRGAIRPAADESARTTVNNPGTTWTPPPPGDRREQLPDDLLALIRGGMPDYTSTACVTAYALAVAVHWSHPRRAELGQWAERMHARCRTNQKFTGQLCVCRCHPQADTNPADLTDAWTPDPPIGCLAVTAEPDPFGYEERERTGRNAGLTVPTDETPDLDNLADKNGPTSENPQASSGDRVDNPADNEAAPDGLREQLRAAIEREVYEYRECTTWWPETAGVTEEIARLATRGAMEIRDRELETLRATLTAVTAEAARRGVISIDGIRNIAKEQQPAARP